MIRGLPCITHCVFDRQAEAKAFIFRTTPLWYNLTSVTILDHTLLSINGVFVDLA